MEENVVIIKLINGDDIICKLEKLNDTSEAITISDPLLIDEFINNEGVAVTYLNDYTKYSIENNIQLNLKNVIFISVPKKNIENLYTYNVNKLRSISSGKPIEQINNEEIEIAKAVVEKNNLKLPLN